MAFELPTNFTVGNTTTAVSGIGSMFQYASYATGNWFGVGLLFVIFIVSLTASAVLNIARSFASASFITFIFSVYFARIGMVSPTIPIYLIAFTIVGFFWAKSERSSTY